MANFHTSKAYTADLEGGFWNDPSAGWTYAGITKKYYPWWPGFKRLEQLRAQKYGFGSIPRYTVFDDQLLKKLVSDFYKDNFWNKLNGEFIANQTIANFMYDFFVHKQNDAIAVINQAAKSIDPQVLTGQAKVSPGVVKVINLNPIEFYSLLRSGRVNYYKTKKGFKSPMRIAFLKRVNKFPESIFE